MSDFQRTKMAVGEKDLGTAKETQEPRRMRKWKEGIPTQPAGRREVRKPHPASSGHCSYEIRIRMFMSVCLWRFIIITAKCASVKSLNT